MKDPAAPKKPRAPRKKKGVAEAGSRGLPASELAPDDRPDEIRALLEQIEADGGKVIGPYRDPLGGHWTVVAGLPIEKVIPTPFQRDLSEAHVKRLTEVIGALDHFLDPAIAVRTPEGQYWVPNGNHRLNAMKNLGAKAIVLLVVPDVQLAYKILALNTEKAHNVKERALEVIRMARSLAGIDPSRGEKDYALEFEEPSLLTLGVAYEQRPRFSGGAYSGMLKRIDGFLEGPIGEAIPTREARAKTLLEVDDAVAKAVEQLKERGFQSPYLKAFVVARVNPIRFAKGDLPPFDEVLDKMLRSAQKFDATKVNSAQVAAASGPPEES